MLCLRSLARSTPFYRRESLGAQSRLTRPVHQDHWLGDPTLQEAGCRPPLGMRWGPSPAGSLPPKVPLRCPHGPTPLSLDPRTPPPRRRGRLPSLWVLPPPDLPSADPPSPAPPVPKSSSVPGLPCSQVPHHPQPHCPQISLFLRGSLVPRSPTAGPPVPGPTAAHSPRGGSRTDGGLQRRSARLGPRRGAPRPENPACHLTK